MKRIAIIALAIAGLLVLASAASAASTVLIKNATILTVTNGTIENGSILIRDGKIAQVGTKVDAPADAQVIDAAGQFVMPGIIDPHSHIAADSINEGAVAVSSMTAIRDVLDPEDIAIYRELAGGVTTANVLHGSANPIGGTNAVIKLRWGKTGGEMLFEGAVPGIKFALGENPKRPGQTTQFGQSTRPPRYPATRMGVEDVIREAFTEARQYMKEWDEYKRRAAGGQSGLVPPRKNLKLEPLVEILRGQRLVHAHCYRADEILMLLRVADEFGFKITSLEHVLEGYKVAKEIAAHGAVASTFSDWWAYKIEAWDAIPYNAAILTKKGVTVALNSDSAELARHLNQEAAKTLKYGGLSETEALKLITLNPAKLLHLDKKVGSIEPGKDADLAIFDKHPLSNYAKVTRVLIDGEVYFDREQDLKHRAEVEKEVKDLKEKERKAAERRPAPEGSAPGGPPGRRRPGAEETGAEVQQ